MTFIGLWLATLVASCYVVFWSGEVRFHHFWHQWEFFSAVSAALYNALIFASVFFLRRRDGRTLDDALGSGIRKLLVFFFRFLVPILLLAWAGLLVWLDRSHSGPVPHGLVHLKLTATLGAFVSFLIGDIIILTRLKSPQGTLSDYTLSGWRREFRTHIFYVHCPFILSYVVLLALYAGRVGSPLDVELALQAFLGGASALEVLLQSTIHALSGLAESNE